MSLKAIRDQIIVEIGGRTDFNSVIDDQINFALQELATMYDFQELEASATTPTASGQSAYLLPSDLYVLWSVKEETALNKPLERKDIQLGFDNVDETKTGTPHFYGVYNRQLIIFNMVPDDNGGSNYSIRIRYWKRHPKLLVDADEMLLPFEWERGLRLKATAMVFGILDQEEKQAAKQAEFDRWVQRISLPRVESGKKNKLMRANFGRTQT